MMEPAQCDTFHTVAVDHISHVLNEFAKNLKNISGKCMDIGCGSGDVTKNILLSFLDPNATMIGTDIMKEMVEYANKTHGDKKRLIFEVLDIQTKNLPKKYISKFDHIFSFHTLQWCSNICQTFKNIYSMLRPGKTMLILMIAHQTTLFKSLEALGQDKRYLSYMGNKKKYIGSLHYLTRPDDEVKKVLEDTGFQVSHCSHRNMKTFLSTENFISMVTLQHTFAFLNKMPHNLREEFKNEFSRMFDKIRVEEYKNRQSDCKLYDDEKETNIPFFYTILIAYAQKKVL